MKSWYAIIAVLFLMLLYCFHCPIDNSVKISFPNENVSVAKQKGQTCSLQLEKVYAQFPGIPNIGTNDVNNGSAPVKVLTGYLSTCHFVYQLCNEAFFKQYLNRLRTILFQQRKEKLMFPFHSFW